MHGGFGIVVFDVIFLVKIIEEVVLVLQGLSVVLGRMVLVGFVGGCLFGLSALLIVRFADYSGWAVIVDFRVSSPEYFIPAVMFSE